MAFRDWTELIAGADDEGLGGADASGLAGLDIAVSEAANPKPFGEDLPDHICSHRARTGWPRDRCSTGTVACSGWRQSAWTEPECVTMTAGQTACSRTRLSSRSIPISSSRAPTPISVCCSSTAPGRSAGMPTSSFYNQPATPDGAVRINGKYATATGMGESGTIHLAAVPAAVARVLVVATMDTEAGHGFGH